MGQVVENLFRTLECRAYCAAPPKARLGAYRRGDLHWSKPRRHYYTVVSPMYCCNDQLRNCRAGQPRVGAPYRFACSSCRVLNFLLPYFSFGCLPRLRGYGCCRNLKILHARITNQRSSRRASKAIGSACLRPDNFKAGRRLYLHVGLLSAIIPPIGLHVLASRPGSFAREGKIQCQSRHNATST